MNLAVRCHPLGSVDPHEHDVRLRTSDIHSGGVGLEWTFSSLSQECPVCRSLVRDLSCSDPACPYRKLHNVLLNSGWVQIQGLDHVPGWEKESNVFGKVVWFKMADEGIHFQFGVKFNRERPPVVSAPRDASIPKARETGPLPGEVSEWDSARWKETLEQSNRKENQTEDPE